MISHKYKFIHIHIPKCAGSSIEKAFGHFEGHDGRNGQDHRTIRMIEQPWLNFKSINSISNARESILRARYKFIKNTNPNNHESITSAEFKSYFKFTIVRNPYSRALSWYRGVIRDEFLLDYYGISKEMKFKEYLQKYLKNTYMLRPQVYWLKNYDGRVKLDYIGKFENIDEVFKKISTYLTNKNITFPHYNKSKKVDYKLYYDDESIDLVSKYYQEDLKTFSYTYE